MDKLKRKYAALRKAARSVHEFGDFEKTAKELFYSCSELIGTTAGYVALLSDDGEENEVLFLEDGGRTCTVPHDYPMPIRGLRAESYHENKVVFDNDFMHGKWVNFMPKGHCTLDNVLFAPLVVDNKTVGIMGLANKQGDFDDEDVEVAQIFGELAAIALQNSRMLEDLSTAEERFRRLVENAKDMIFRIALPSGSYEFVSPASLGIFGYTPQEFYDSPLLLKSIIHPDWRDFFQEQWKKLLRGEVEETYEYPIIHKSGEQRWLNQRNVLILDDQGNPVALEGIISDITKKQMADRALWRSEARLQEAQAIAKVGSWEFDIQTSEIWASNEGFRIYGMTPPPSNLLSIDDIEACIPESKKVHQALVDLIKEDKPYALEFDIIPADGSDRKTIISKASLERDDKGNPLRIAGVVMDVTEHAQMRESILRANERLNEAQRIGSMGDWSWDPHTDTVTWSPNLYDILGIDPESPVPDYENIMALYHPDDRDKHRQAVEQALKEGKGFEVEVRRTRPDGTTVVIQARGRAEYDEGGKVSRLYGTVLDITGQKAIEKQLQSKNDTLNGIVNSLPGMLSVMSPDYRILHTNNHKKDAIGLDEEKPDNPVGLACYNYFQNRTEPCPWCKISEVFTTGRTVVELTEPGDPRERITGKALQIYVAPIHDEHGNVAHALEYVVDVTELRRIKEKSEAANRAKSEFLANMSHEIRTPLNGLMGMLQLLKTTQQDSEQSEFTDLALQSSRRLLRLLSDILDLAKVEAGKMHFYMAPFEFNETINGVFELFLPLAMKKKVDFSVHINPSIPNTMCGDTVRLQQVLSNLVGNAIKFTDAGHVEINAHPLPSRQPYEYRVLFSVTDTGIGMPNEFLGQLFTPFAQAEQGYNRNFQGTGLGLSISNQIVEFMGGEMTAESEEGIGSTFYFCIPFKLAEHSSPALSAEGEQTELADLKILVAEDDASSKFVALKFLEKAGHQVVGVNDGEQALAALKEQSFDLVLMDVQMPVLDGIEATKAIRQGVAGIQNKDIPIIAMTAYAMAGDKGKFLEAGMNGYVSKPVEMEELEKIMNQVFENRERQQ